MDLASPPTCAGCGLTGDPWCADCTRRTQTIVKPFCPACGEPGDPARCGHCESFPVPFHKARSFAAYREPFRRLVVRLKHVPDSALGNRAAELTHSLAKDLGSAADLAVPVPLSPARAAARGYNQVDLFARPLTRALGIAYAPAALVRVRETVSQVGLSGHARRRNLASAFRADETAVRGRNILLLDDVFTTGSTADACTRALQEAGSGPVLVFTLARAIHEEAIKMR